jgi:adenine phosphoribosyltransferase
MTSRNALLTTLDIGSCFPNRVDFPRIGFNFPDITPILERRPDVLAAIVNEIADTYREHAPSHVACIESFGYVFGVPVALALGSRVVLVRRPGKLPRPAITTRYRMCYDDDRRLEIHADALPRGSRALIVDDFLASGGTAIATAELLRTAGADVIAAAFVVELPALRGAEATTAAGLNTSALLRLEFSPAARQWKHVEEREREASLAMRSTEC